MPLTTFSTLEKIAKGGADVFYTGDMAKSMVKLTQATNGTMTLQDLADYKVLVKRALSIDFRGYKVFTTGAPSSGAIALNMLKTMEQYQTTHLSAMRTHWT